MSRDTADDWLSLGEASALLGVHTSTLRRWADAGRVPCQRTAGGHRRFSRHRLRPLLRAGAGTPAGSDPGPVPDDEAWRARFADAGTLDALRELGQRSSGIALQFLTRDDADRRFLAEGRGLGTRYAEMSRAAGVGRLDAVRAFLFYRGRIVDILPQATADPGDATRSVARYDRFMNEVLLGLLEGYEPDPGARPT